MLILLTNSMNTRYDPVFFKNFWTTSRNLLMELVNRTNSKKNSVIFAIFFISESVVSFIILLSLDKRDNNMTTIMEL